MKKKVGGKLAVVKSSSAVALPSNLVERYAKYTDAARAVSKVAAGGWQWLTTANGTFSDGAKNDLGTELDVIVLAVARGNFYYTEKYNASEKSPPKCFALSELNDVFDEAAIAPPATLTTRESDGCLNCRWNQFKSGDNGVGKACRNYILLSVLPADEATLADPKKIAKAEGARIRVAPTSMKNFAKYARSIAGKERPLFSMITTLKLEKHPKNQFQMLAEDAGYLQSEALLDAIEARLDEARDQILAPPPVAAEETKKSKEKSNGSTTRRRSAGSR